jgi:hypothetical protein
MNRPPPAADPQRERRDALRALDRLGDEPTLAGSSLAAAGRRAAEHLAGRNAGEAPSDPIELWGRRIGRLLSLAGCIALAVYLYVTYVR